MSNGYYNAGGVPALNAAGTSSDIRAELQQISAAFEKLPTFGSNAGKTIRVNSAETGLVAVNPTIPPIATTDPGYSMTQDGVVGKKISITGNLTLIANEFEPGDWFDIYNNTDIAKTLTAGAGLTLRLHGSVATGNRTLAIRGVTRVYYNSTTEAIVTGSDVT